MTISRASSSGSLLFEATASVRSGSPSVEEKLSQTAAALRRFQEDLVEARATLRGLQESSLPTGSAPEVRALKRERRVRILLPDATQEAPVAGRRRNVSKERARWQQQVMEPICSASQHGMPIPDVEEPSAYDFKANYSPRDWVQKLYLRDAQAVQHLRAAIGSLDEVTWQVLVEELGAQEEGSFWGWLPQVRGLFQGFADLQQWGAKWGIPLPSEESFLRQSFLSWPPQVTSPRRLFGDWFAEAIQDAAFRESVKDALQHQAGLYSQQESSLLPCPAEDAAHKRHVLYRKGDLFEEHLCTGPVGHLLKPLWLWYQVVRDQSAWEAWLKQHGFEPLPPQREMPEAHVAAIYKQLFQPPEMSASRFVCLQYHRNQLSSMQRVIVGMAEDAFAALRAELEGQAFRACLDWIVEFRGLHRDLFQVITWLTQKLGEDLSAIDEDLLEELEWWLPGEDPARWLHGIIEREEGLLASKVGDAIQRESARLLIEARQENLPLAVEWLQRRTGGGGFVTELKAQ